MVHSLEMPPRINVLIPPLLGPWVMVHLDLLPLTASWFGPGLSNVFLLRVAICGPWYCFDDVGGYLCIFTSVLHLLGWLDVAFLDSSGVGIGV